MVELLKEEPWLIVPCLALLIPIFGVVFGTITNYLSTVRRAEIEAALKQDMLQRGMSAEEIKTVIEATSSSKGKDCKSEMASSKSHS
jgi:hypothetical protein